MRFVQWGSSNFDGLILVRASQFFLIQYCTQGAKILRRSMSGDQTSTNPFLDSSLIWPWLSSPISTSRSTKRNNYGNNSQTWLSNIHQLLFLQLTLFSLFTFQFFQELQGMRSRSVSILCKCICATFKSVNVVNMLLLAGSVTINHVVGIKTTFSFFVS